MTYDKDPPRLRLSGDPNDPFVRALEDARGELPGAEQLNAIADRLPLFEAPPASFVTMARARLRAKSMQAAAIALAAAVGVSAAVVIRNALPVQAPPSGKPSEAQPESPPQAAAPAKRSRVVPRAPVQQEPATTVPGQIEAPRPPEPQTVREHGLGVAPAAQSALRHDDGRPSQGDFPASDVDGPATPETETALLGRAHQALASNPARALALTAQHRREYPSGVLGQESDLIAIEALAALGRQSEARASAARFRARFPSSAHLRRLDRLLGPAEGPGNSPLER
jgi:hypothetical protein